MLTAALFTTAKWRQRKRPSAGERTRGTRSVGAVDPSLREDSLTPARYNRDEGEDAVRSEGSQSRRTAAVGLPSNAVPGGGEVTGTESRAVVPGLEAGTRELWSTGDSSSSRR